MGFEVPRVLKVQQYYCIDGNSLFVSINPSTHFLSTEKEYDITMNQVIRRCAKTFYCTNSHRKISTNLSRTIACTLKEKKFQNGFIFNTIADTQIIGSAQ